MPILSADTNPRLTTSIENPDTIDYSYDNLDRLTLAEYSITDESNEVFTIDDLGNRNLVNVRDGSNVNYVIDANTNRYTEIDGAYPEYDAAGNLVKDYNSYEYEYDYENSITKITKSGPTTVAEFAYDALGRRIKKVDSVAGTTNVYYYNDKWQVLCDYNDTGAAGTGQRWFAYGNYIDEALIMGTGTLWYEMWYYAHDHLYSPVFLAGYTGVPVERYEYDAYGNCQIMDASYNPRATSNYDNPYLFTGRRLDILDNGALKLQYNRNRYYDQYTGRWYTHDPLGITPNPQWPNRFEPFGQFKGGSNIYEYVKTNPVIHSDPWGLMHYPGYPDPRKKKKDFPCKCYCVENVAITRASRHMNARSVGASFTVTISGKWKTHDCYEPATLVWWEWFLNRPEYPSDVAPLYSGLMEERWHEMFHRYKKFSYMHMMDELKKVQDVYKITDRPEVRVDPSGRTRQEANIIIGAWSSRKCPCPEPKISFVGAHQDIDVLHGLGGPEVTGRNVFDYSRDNNMPPGVARRWNEIAPPGLLPGDLRPPKSYGCGFADSW